MRKLLYGTSALVAAGLLQADPAFAQAKESPVTLTLGGRFHAFYEYADQKDSQLAAPVRDHGLRREAEIHFRGRTALNNGLRAGVFVSLEAETCADQIDESYIWFEHDSFGRLEVGSTDQVGWKMFYGAPAIIPNFSFAQINMRAYNPSAGLATGVQQPQALLNLANDAEHISYFTPRFFGFQLGVSYTPENCQEAITLSSTNPGAAAPGANTCTGALGLPVNKNANQQGDIWEGALNFVQKFGDFNVGLYGAINHGVAEATQTGQIASPKNQMQWGVGGSVSAYGFTLGAHYKWDNQGLQSATYNSWAAGLSYTWSDWTVGVGYGRASAENAGTGTTALVGNGTRDRIEQIQLGVQYAGIGPGINLWGGVLFFDQKDGNPPSTCSPFLNSSTAGGAPTGSGACSADGNDGFTVVLGTTITY